MSKYVVSREECSRHNIFPGVEHKAVAGDKPVKALDVFCPIREDYL